MFATYFNNLHLLVSPTAAPELIDVADVIGIRGQQIQLLFIVKHAAPMVVPNGTTWMFEPSNGEVSKQLKSESDPRYTFSEDRLSLNISDLKFNDDGKYTFKAMNEIGTDSTSINLVVDGE